MNSDSDLSDVGRGTERAEYERDAVRYGSTMLRRFGWFYYLTGMWRWLTRIRLDDFSTERIRTASSNGSVVYAMYSASHIDYAAFNAVLNRRHLPLSNYANGVNTWYWMPIAVAWRRWFAMIGIGRPYELPPHPITSGWLSGAVAVGATTTIHLDEQSSVLRWLARSGGDPVEALIKATELTDSPIQVLPVAVVWDRSPGVVRSNVLRFLSTNNERVTTVRRLFNLLFRNKSAFVQVGNPLDLHAFCERVPTARRPKALRALLRRQLRRESQTVRGPRLLPRSVMRKMVLENPPMRSLAREVAAETGKSTHSVERRMLKEYNAMAAHFRWWVIPILYNLLKPLWSRVYSGIDVNDEDLEKIRAAIRDGSAVIAPCHRSHFDYLLVSCLFYEREINVPHIVAGANLAIWPLSIVLRGAGAFFIQRSFAGKRTFPVIFSRYLRELVRLGYPIEFFVEGGRSRSGKLLEPKVGVLSYLLNAADFRKSGQEVTILPVALAYEQVAEERSYAREIAGKRKKAETLGQVVKSPTVLKRRLGRVYLRVGEPLKLSDLDHEMSPYGELSPNKQFERANYIGRTILHRISAAMVVLPTALLGLSLLSHHRRAMRSELVLERALRFREALLRLGLQEASSLQTPSHSINAALDRFHHYRIAGRARPLIEAHEDEQGRVWAPVLERRVILEIYKNQALPPLAPMGFAGLAIRALGGEEIDVSAVVDRVDKLRHLLGREFTLDPSLTSQQITNDALNSLVAYGALTVSDDGLFSIGNSDYLREINGAFINFVESYLLVATHLPRILETKGEAETLARAVIELPEEIREKSSTRPESLNFITVKNAVKSALRDGVVVERSGSLEIDESARDRWLLLLQPMVRM